MEKINSTSRRKRGKVSHLFVIGCLIDYNFKSFKKFLIYILHYIGIIDLRFKKSELYTDKEIVEILDNIINEKVSKTLLYELTDLSKNTFNKNFKDYFEKHELVGRRKFTLWEAYQILDYWQGEGNWGNLHSIKKETLSKVLNNRDYKKTAADFKALNKNNSYKNKDKYSPREVKKIIHHIEEEKEVIEELIGYDEFHNMRLWAFAIMYIFLVLVKAKEQKVLAESKENNLLKKHKVIIKT